MSSHSSCQTALRERLEARTLPPVTIRELRLALQDEWAAMPQQLIDTLILSMGRRCETCLVVREIISPTKDRMFLAGHPSQGCFGLDSAISGFRYAAYQRMNEAMLNGKRPMVCCPPNPGYKETSALYDANYIIFKHESNKVVISSLMNSD
ncbi:transposable element Tcb2 transposase [Trichonephila clavipes]|nr:transposable element Tcb2 transposase [Trichonephila clavipes]